MPPLSLDLGAGNTNEAGFFGFSETTPPGAGVVFVSVDTLVCGVFLMTFVTEKKHMRR